MLPSSGDVQVIFAAPVGGAPLAARRKTAWKKKLHSRSRIDGRTDENAKMARRLSSAFFWLPLSAVLVSAQVDIREKGDGIIRQKHDDSNLVKEIYTSMQQLTEFYEREKLYVNDLTIIQEKKLVFQESMGAIGAYVASYDDVLGEQDDDETFLYNPLNVYNLIRHVAIGWPIIEDALNKEKERRKGNLPKRVKRALARSKRDHVPGAPDLDGIAVGIVRLHDYYKFNMTSFVEEGAFETEDFRSETNGDLTIWDAFKIGVKGTNQMFLGSGIEIMIHALEKAKSDGGVVTVPPFIDALDVKVLKNLIKTAKTVHDQKLDRWGPRTPTHSTNARPYDKRLGKKKKFLQPKEFEVKLGNAKIVDTRAESEQYMRLCRGEELRPPSETKKLFCKYESRGKPYYVYGPRKVEVVNLSPYIAVVHEFITESEADAIVKRAAPDLKRSQMVGKSMNGSLDDRRVSEQTWLSEETSPEAARLTVRIDDYLDLESGSGNHSEFYQVRPSFSVDVN